MVLSDSGIFSKYRGVTGTLPEEYWAYMGHRVEGRQPTRRSRAPTPCPIRIGHEGGTSRGCLLLSTMAHEAH